MSDTRRFDPEGRDDEVAEVRDAYRERPGISGQVEQALAERENAVAYGADTSGPDKRLRQLGHTRQRRTRPEAAEERKAAAGDGEEARRSPPEGRQARPKDTAGDEGEETGRSGKAGDSATAKPGAATAAGAAPRGDPKGR